MGLFGFIKRKDPIQEYLDGFFKNMTIIDIIVASDIPLKTFNGNEHRRIHADIFFKDHTRTLPRRINSFIQDSDAIFWIFDTFFVFELDASKDDTRQYIILKLVTLQHDHGEQNGLGDRLDAMKSSIKILGLKEQLDIPTMEVIVFKEAWDFFLKNHNQGLEILKRKYCASKTSVQDSLREAQAAYENGDYTIAFKEFQQLSEQGHAQAQSNLGFMYIEGQGISQNYKEAIRYFRLAAEQDHAIAQFNLGNMYRRGKGVSKNYKEAVRWYLLAAKQGDAGAQFNLGQLFNQGKGVSQDHKEAIKWYERAAEQGNVNAQLKLGIMYVIGQGIPQDNKEAAKWLRLAAEQGDAGAQTQLGKMYYHGQGVSQDYKEAAKWYRLVAQQGDAVAQRLLGYIFYEGQGTPQDYKEAVKWYRLAAEQGDTSAQIYLGVMHAKGQGMLEDILQAHKWFNIAAATGNEDAQKNRKFTESKMSLEQIEKAQTLAREWLAN